MKQWEWDIITFQFFFYNEINRVLFLPLFAQASNQLTELQEIINGRQWEHTQKDSWHYNWGPIFSSKKAYSHLQGSLEASPLFKWIWKSGNLGKYKFFAWLLLKDRLSTRNLLRRKKHVPWWLHMCIMYQWPWGNKLPFVLWVPFQYRLLELHQYSLGFVSSASGHDQPGKIGFWKSYFQRDLHLSLLDNLEG